MSLPRFFDRVADAVSPALGGLAGSELGDRLEGMIVGFEASPDVAGEHRAGFMLAVNLAARLWPRIVIRGPEELTEEAARLAVGVNPEIDLAPDGPPGAVLVYGPRRPEEPGVLASADGWNARLGSERAELAPAAAPAALAAGALGVGALFLLAFDDLARRREDANGPAGLNLITLGEPQVGIPIPGGPVHVGTVHLAGAGAVGQAAVATLRELTLTGRVVAVDHEDLGLSNLQRYLLAFDADVGMAKTDLVERALDGSGLEVVKVPYRWGRHPDARPPVDTVLAALDTEQGRIDLQAGLPRRIFNGFTGPNDLGVSRHVGFGTAPCLACLYHPRGARPHEFELIADALAQDPVRILSYLTARIPVDRPLQPAEVARTAVLSPPSGWEAWTQRSLLDDVTEAFSLRDDERATWAGRHVGDLYRDGICGGAIVHDGASSARRHVVVPLAHQAALAGILAATWLVADSSTTLRGHLPAEIEGRLDVLAGLPQVVPRPRARTPGCLCDDPVYRVAHDAAHRHGGPRASSDTRVSRRDQIR